VSPEAQRERRMKKEELEAILGSGEGELDLGPIEECLHAVATERTRARRYCESTAGHALLRIHC
jgi:hypothetical protein